MTLAQGLLESNPHDTSFSLTLVPGESGSFDVKKDGEMVYSKRNSGRLPTPQDLGLVNHITPLPITENASSKKCC